MGGSYKIKGQENYRKVERTELMKLRVCQLGDAIVGSRQLDERLWALTPLVSLPVDGLIHVFALLVIQMDVLGNLVDRLLFWWTVCWKLAFVGKLLSSFKHSPLFHAIIDYWKGTHFLAFGPNKHISDFFVINFDLSDLSINPFDLSLELTVLTPCSL